MQLNNKFLKYFKKSHEMEFFAPGRVNLIGEHIDYNGGNVFPCAIDLGTYAYVRRRDDNKYRMISLNFEKQGIYEFDQNNLNYKKDDDWTNYVKGMIKYMAPQGGGFDILFYGNIPNGAGLSSSASIEMLMGYILRDINNLSCSDLDIIKYGVKVENEYIGVNSGIMDQFAVMMGKENHAISLNTDTLEFDYVPLNLNEYVILIMNTNKRRGLNDSKYNERRSECDVAFEILKSSKIKSNLCEYTLEELDNNKNKLNDKNYKRAHHAISEQARTKKAKEVLDKGDLLAFGRLMNESHASLRDDYEVTGIELDTIVELAQKQESVIGARVTGAGFGGCAIALAKEDEIGKLINNIAETYKEKIGYAADFYIVRPSKGVHKIK